MERRPLVRALPLHILNGKRMLLTELDENGCPVNPPRKYQNPPIEEAVCDIQFVPSADWNPTLPGRLYELLKGTYGEKPRLQHMIEAQIQTGGQEEEPQIQHRIGKQRVQLLAEKGTRIVGIGPDRLSVHMLKPYTGWDQYRPRIFEALGAYKQISIADSVMRLGLRYINRINIKSKTPNLGEFFTIPPKFPTTNPPTRILGFFNRKESEFEDKPIRVVVTFTDVQNDRPDMSSYLLDIDIIWLRAEEPIPLGDIAESLDLMKSRHREVFESLITDETRKLFDAD